ncbi:unnamed protein product [Leuciscus chuanchicus]
MNTINIFIWTIALFIQECRGQITVTQSPSITAVQPGEEVRINCKTSSDVYGGNQYYLAWFESFDFKNEVEELRCLCNDDSHMVLEQAAVENIFLSTKENKSPGPDHIGTDEHTHLLIRWRVAHEALFTGKRNAAIKGFESFVVEQDLQGRDLKCPQTGVSTEDGGATAASWKWYAAMDEAIGGRPSITPPALVASCGPDVAVASSSSVRPEPARPRKRVKDLEDLIQEMEERERKAAEREERLWREMEEKEDRRERERRERDERQEREVREREERWHREASEREERRDKETKERDEKFLSVLEILAKK